MTSRSLSISPYLHQLQPDERGLHSSTIQLNVSTFMVYVGWFHGVLVTKTAQDELKSGRVVQGLTLVHLSAYREHFLWETLGPLAGFSDKNGSG